MTIESMSFLCELERPRVKLRGSPAGAGQAGENIPYRLKPNRIKAISFETEPD